MVESTAGGAMVKMAPTTPGSRLTETDLVEEEPRMETESHRARVMPRIWRAKAELAAPATEAETGLQSRGSGWSRTDQCGAGGTRESGGAGGLIRHGGDGGARSQGGGDGSKDRGGVQDSEAGGGDRGSSRWKSLGGSERPDGADWGWAEGLTGTSRDRAEELAGIRGGRGRLGGSSGDAGELDGTSRDSGDSGLGGTSGDTEDKGELGITSPNQSIKFSSKISKSS